MQSISVLATCKTDYFGISLIVTQSYKNFRLRELGRIVICSISILFAYAFISLSARPKDCMTTHATRVAQKYHFVCQICLQNSYTYAVYLITGFLENKKPRVRPMTRGFLVVNCELRIASTIYAPRTTHHLLRPTAPCNKSCQRTQHNIDADVAKFTTRGMK